MAILFGGLVNIPVYEFKSPGGIQPQMAPYMVARYKLPAWLGHRTVIAVNLGGCIISLALSAYFALKLPLLPLFLTAVIVALGVYYFARPVRSVGVTVPAYIPPLLATGASMLALCVYGGDFSSLARMAFVSGVIGTLVGANILHMPRICSMGSEFISIGGAGTFDGILLTGIIATILAIIASI